MTYVSSILRLNFSLRNLPADGSIRYAFGKVNKELFLTDLENQALAHLLSGESIVFETLRSQLSCLEVTCRKWTALGLETSFIVPCDDICLEEQQKFQLSDVYARFGGIAPDPGLVLWINNGKIYQLLCFSFDPGFNDKSRLEELYYIDVSDNQTAYDVHAIKQRNEEKALRSYYLRCRNEYKPAESG